MSRKKGIPTLRYHVSGQSVVTFCGKNFYLGPHGSPEATARYYALVAEYTKGGMKEPPAQETHQNDAVITVGTVCGEYRRHIKERYANDRQERNRLKGLCDLLELEHADVPADQFGPVRLREVRDVFVANGNSRKYVNRLTHCVVKIFKHAVQCELIDINVLLRLKTLEPLKEGQTKAPETDPVEPVDMEAVSATAKHLSPIIKAMVEIQAVTGMRPGEVCIMRPLDIEKRDDGVWIYRPESHKTKRYGKQRVIPIVGDTRITLGLFLERDPEAFCFSPKEAMAHRHAEANKKRKTPKGQGNKIGTNRKKKPKRVPGDLYSSGSYYRAIVRAAKKAKVDHWFPYQLRHAAATAVREALGIEAAQALLGHSKIDMTAHYAKVTEKTAVEAAKAMAAS